MNVSYPYCKAALGVLVFLGLLFGMPACEQAGHTFTEYRLKATSDSISLPRVKIEGMRSVRPVYYWDSTEQKGYFYSLWIGENPAVHKYAGQWGQYRPLDTFPLPEAARVGPYASIENFIVIKQDSFALNIPKWVYKHRFLVMGSSSVDTVPKPKLFQRGTYHLFMDIYDFIHPFVGPWMVASAYRREGLAALADSEGHVPRWIMFHTKDTAQKILGMYMPPELEKYKERVHIKHSQNRIFSATGMESVLYEYHLSGKKEIKHDLSCRYMEKSFDPESEKSYYAELYGSDHIKQIRWSPFYPDLIFLEVHEKGVYVEDGYKKSFHEADKNLLLYNYKEKRYIGRVDLPPTKELPLFHMQATEDGFYLFFRYGEGEKRTDVYRKYVLEKVN